jgi:tRNA pseudouridine38-40 synthase
MLDYGKIDAKQIPDIINNKDRNLAGKTLPAHGLYLVNVIYK